MLIGSMNLSIVEEKYDGKNSFKFLLKDYNMLFCNDLLLSNCDLIYMINGIFENW